jgi:hypothetical protein
LKSEIVVKTEIDAQSTQCNTPSPCSRCRGHHFLDRS